MTLTKTIRRVTVETHGYVFNLHGLATWKWSELRLMPQSKQQTVAARLTRQDNRLNEMNAPGKRTREMGKWRGNCITHCRFDSSISSGCADWLSRQPDREPGCSDESNGNLFLHPTTLRRLDGISSAVQIH
jgi:hypothetical protein